MIVGAQLRHLGRLARVFRDYRAERTRLRQQPVRLWVESTSLCNLRCPYCPNMDIAKEDHGRMDLPQFREIVDQVAGEAYDLNLFHRGEPMIHPKLPEMVAYAKSKGLYTRIHTNATFLNEEKGQALIDAGLDFLSCSFDGYEKEVYERNRVGAKFDKVLANVTDFLALKRRLRAKRPFVVIQVMEIGYENRPGREIRRLRREFLAHFRDLPLDKLIIRRPHNWGGDIDIPELSRDRLLADGRSFTPCTFLWYSSTILWDGTVTACPQDFFGKLAMGDLKKQPLREIWNDEPLVSLREKMVRGEIPEELPCYRCDRIWRKTVAGVPTDYLAVFLSDHLASYGPFRRWLGL